MRYFLNSMSSLYIFDNFSALRSDLVEQRPHFAYFAEGLAKENDWKNVMKHQRINGSLFNSPSTTAAALVHLNDDKCFRYLQAILQRYENAGIFCFQSLVVYYLRKSQAARLI